MIKNIIIKNFIFSNKIRFSWNQIKKEWLYEWLYAKKYLMRAYNDFANELIENQISIQGIKIFVIKLNQSRDNVM